MSTTPDAARARHPDPPRRPEIEGVALDADGRCAHWHGPNDILAIRFRCCDRYFACHACHEAVVGHAPERWPPREFDRVAVLCGACRTGLSIARYLAAPARCPSCGVGFNPRCVLHHHLYFEVPPSAPGVTRGE